MEGVPEIKLTIYAMEEICSFVSWKMAGKAYLIFISQITISIAFLVLEIVHKAFVSSKKAFLKLILK